MVSLADKSEDTDRVPPGGRWDRHWRTLRLSARKIGVDTIVDDKRYRDPAEARRYFRLRSIEFGRWMNESDRQHWLYGSAHGLEVLSRILGVPADAMGLNETLSLALGARGRGGRAMAHYEPTPYLSINLTKTKGAGSLAHEYGHAIDHAASMHIDKADWASGGSTDTIAVSESIMKLKNIRGDFERLFAVLYYNGTPNVAEHRTPFARYLAALTVTERAGYWRSRLEVWARVFHAWVAWRLDAMDIRQTFLASPTPPRGELFMFPDWGTIERVAPHIETVITNAYALFRADTASEDAGTAVPIGTQRTTVRTPDGEIEGRYALVPLGRLITSHDPLSWSHDTRYPRGCQQREYHRDANEQMKVQKGAQTLEPSYLVTDTPTAVDGPPVVTAQGSDYLVLSGNGRTMMLRMATKLGTFTRYTDYLRHRAPQFGFGAPDVTKTSVLVRVVDVDVAGKCAYYSNLFNKGLTQGIDHTTEAFAHSRQLAPAALELIAEIIETADAETMADVYANPRASRSIAGVLRKAKILSDQNARTFTDAGGLFHDAGKLRVSAILLGALLEERELTDMAKAYTAQILRTAPLLIQSRTLGKDWDIMPLIADAIRAESERRSAGTTKADFLKQISFVRPEVAADVRVVWDALDAGPRRFSEFIKTYISRAKTESQGSGLGFHEPLDRAGVLRTLTGAQLSDGYGAHQVMERRYRPLVLSPQWSAFLGDDIPATFSMLIWGQKGNGKSTFLLQLADELGRHGPVFLDLAEEPVPGRSVQYRLEKTGLSLRNVTMDSISDWPSLMQRVDTDRYRFILIDSIQKMGLYATDREMVQTFIANRHKFGWVFIGRSDKSGDFAAGSSAWGYEVDIEVEVRKFIATIIKHRYMDPRDMNKKIHNVLTNR
jgi:hypothetical protein